MTVKRTNRDGFTPDLTPVITPEVVKDNVNEIVKNIFVNIESKEFDEAVERCGKLTDYLKSVAEEAEIVEEREDRKNFEYLASKLGYDISALLNNTEVNADI